MLRLKERELESLNSRNGAAPPATAPSRMSVGPGTATGRASMIPTPGKAASTATINALEKDENLRLSSSGSRMLRTSSSMLRTTSPTSRASLSTSITAELNQETSPSGPVSTAIRTSSIAQRSKEALQKHQGTHSLTYLLTHSLTHSITHPRAHAESRRKEHYIENLFMFTLYIRELLVQRLAHLVVGRHRRSLDDEVILILFPNDHLPCQDQHTVFELDWGVVPSE